VPKNEFVIVQVEVRTGIVLNLSGKRHTGSGERFLFFKTSEEAAQKSREIVRVNPEIECIVQNENNVEMLTVRDEDHARTILRNAKEAKGTKSR
jgi:hypothetical protein